MTGRWKYCQDLEMSQEEFARLDALPDDRKGTRQLTDELIGRIYLRDIEIDESDIQLDDFRETS